MKLITRISDIFELDYLAFMVCKDLNDDFFDISIQRVFNIIPKVLNFWGSLDVDEIENEIQECFVEDCILDAINAGKYDEKMSYERADDECNYDRQEELDELAQDRYTSSIALVGEAFYTILTSLGLLTVKEISE